MKSGYIFLLIIFLSFELHSQLFSGRVIDSKSGEPLEYVSIGIVNTQFGTITDEKGYFNIEAKNQSPQSKCNKCVYIVS